MGKSTTAAMFAARGYPVWDADAAVHRLYRAGGGAVEAVAAAFPSAVSGDSVDRAALRRAIARDPAALRRLEAIVHPLVAADREASHARARESGARIAVYDIPLLFETGADALMHGTVVVSAGPATQRARVLARPGMSEAMLAQLLFRQLSDAAKRARADWIIATNTLAEAETGVDRVCTEILARPDPETLHA